MALFHEEENEEGRVTIDMYETDSEFVILAPVAGVSPKDIEVLLKKDILIIRGKRKPPEEMSEKHYLYRECFWGPFSRTIFLPHHLNTSKIQAKIYNGLLILRIPKEGNEKIKEIKVEESELS
jgi:HSP20 family protein